MNSIRLRNGGIGDLNNNRSKQIVHVVQHARPLESEGDDDVKLIGVYSTREAALGAIERLSGQPGFRDFPEGFHIDEYPIDFDHWAGGFGAGD